MSKFTVEESNLMCIYNTGSRADLLLELTEMQSHLAADETELLTLTKTVMDKLSAMSDEEFESLWLILSRRKPTHFCDKT